MKESTKRELRESQAASNKKTAALVRQLSAPRPLEAHRTCPTTPEPASEPPTPLSVRLAKLTLERGKAADEEKDV